MPQANDSEATITAGKNKLANICIYGQIKSNVLMKEIAGQMPNNAKQLSRDLIAAAARVLRPDTTPELVRDILHYRSRKVRCLLKEWKSGKIDVPLEQRLIECEKALLNTLELSASMPTNFMINPEINNRSMEILSHMHSYIMDANFRQILLPTLPPLITSETRHNSDGSTTKHKETENDSTEINVKNGGDQEQESDGDSVHASSSSFEDCTPAVVDTNNPIFGLNYSEHLQAALLNSTASTLNNAINEQIKSVPLIDQNNRRSSIISGTTTTGSSLNNGNNNNSGQKMTGRKRKYEENQLEIIEMKKELIRLQQAAFERQILMCDEIVGMLKEMRSWLDIQKRTSTLATNNSVNTLPQLNSLPNSFTNPLISNQLSSNLNTLTSLLAGATNTVTSPQFI